MTATVTGMLLQRRERGFSLVEIMIALVIGLVVTLVVGQIFVGNKQTFRTQEDVARVQEDVRFAIDVLNRTLRMAGYKGNGSATTFAAALALDGADSATAAGSDSIIVRFDGADNLAGTAADGSVVSCLGTSVRFNNISFNRFYIANDAANNNEPTLFCDTTDDGTQNGTALIPGVESMQILYGVDTDANRTANAYVHITDVPNKDNVVAVSVSMLVRTANQVGVAVDTKTYKHFGADYPNYLADSGADFNPANDSRIRRLFSTTIGLRNRLN